MAAASISDTAIERLEKYRRHHKEQNLVDVVFSLVDDLARSGPRRLFLENHMIRRVVGPPPPGRSGAPED